MSTYINIITSKINAHLFEKKKLMGILKNGINLMLMELICQLMAL